jgi:hypothetical protein
VCLAKITSKFCQNAMQNDKKHCKMTEKQRKMPKNTRKTFEKTPKISKNGQKFSRVFARFFKKCVFQKMRLRKSKQKNNLFCKN